MVNLATRAACAVLVGGLATAALAEGAAVAVAFEEDGKFFTEEGTPTFQVQDDGTVDWYTFSGFRRYHAECHVCHGPDGEGSSYAPALKRSAHDLGYDAFVSIVAAGKQRVGGSDNQVMPAFGLNNNVMCYIDDMFVYLLARGDDSVPRGRPAKRAEKPQGAIDFEKDCMG
jgi:methanol metabolism-related c-type cytochrome